MPIRYVLLISRQGKLRLAKWFIPLSSKAKAKIVQDLTQLTLSRRQHLCNFLEYKGEKFIPTVVYRRYASLFFICQIGDQDNELVTLEIIHRYVEILDQFFGNQAYAVLDELIISGEMQETSKTTPLRMITGSEMSEDDEARLKLLEEAILL